MPRVPAADIVALVGGAGDPAFAVDATRTIIAWNRAAERLLQISAAEALGRNCAQVIAGRDARGRPVCDTLCPAVLALRRREPLEALELEIDRRNGAPLWVSCTSLILTDGGHCVVHILRDVTEEHHRRSFVRQVLQGAIAITSPDPDGPLDSSPVVLSPRQTTILRMLASGATTRSIASALGISPATVRNHVQQIMNALKAHSRLEAVITALQRRVL